MNERRRFLKVIGGSVIAIGAAPLAEGCSGEGSDSTGGGAGGTGGMGSATSSTTGSTTSSAGGVTSSSQSAGGATSSSSSGCPLPPGVVAGAPDLYTTSGLHKVPGTKVLIGRDAAGLYALSSICTHKSCNLSTISGKILASGGIHCNCHGSEFDSIGNVTKVAPTPPVPTPLPCYKLELGCDGQLYVDTMTSADRNVDRVQA
jgi:Rieske Fe-S protein